MRKPRDIFMRVDTDGDGGPDSVEFVTELPDDAEFIICMRLSVPLMLPDNAVGRCAACDGPIQFRPVVPPQLVKVCLECAPAWVEARANPQ